MEEKYSAILESFAQELRASLLGQREQNKAYGIIGFCGIYACICIKKWKNNIPKVIEPINWLL